MNIVSTSTLQLWYRMVYVLYSGNLGLVRKLLRLGADPDSQDNAGKLNVDLFRRQPYLLIAQQELEKNFLPGCTFCT